MNDPKSWLSASQMNMLVDYYPEVPFRPYGSGATRENVLPVLRDLELGYLCIYAKGHSGYTTWPSALKTQHVMLARDMPRFYREVTRETGTKLVLYYSGLLDGIAGLRHPEWRMRHQDGSEQQYFGSFPFFISYANCPHSSYFTEWVAVQLRELVEWYDPDGFWVDGDWPTPCYCERCRVRFGEETGWRESWEALQQRADFCSAYEQFWNRVTDRWRNQFNAFLKALKPDCAYSAGNVSPRREFLAPFDWRSGDFFSPGFFCLHDMARMMRWYGTLGIPYDAYVCDTSFTHVREKVRSRSKSTERMLQEAATIAANGGGVGYWTYPLGNGALVPSRMENARAVQQFLTARRHVFQGTQSIPWTVIAVTDPATPTFGGAATEGAHKCLAALHRSPDLTDESGLSRDMPYDLVVIPEQAVLDDATAAMLTSYVERGGRLLTSGRTIDSPLLQQLLGVSAVQRGAVQDGHVLLKTHREPTGVDAGWDALTLTEGEELYPLYLSWDQFNPECRFITNNWPMHGLLDEEHPEAAGIPAAVGRRIGKGSIAHICTDIFTQYRTYGDPQMLRWLREVLQWLDPTPFFTTDAPSWVDVSLRGKGEALLLHFVNTSPGRDVAKLHTDDTWVDEIPTLSPLTCHLRLAQPPTAVTIEPGATPALWHYADGELTVTLPQLKIHACLKIDGWQQEQVSPS